MNHPPRKTVPRHITEAIKAGEEKLAAGTIGIPAEGTPPPAAPPAPPVELPPIPQAPQPVAPAPAPAAAPPVAPTPPAPASVDLGLEDMGIAPPASQPKHTPGPRPGESPEETIRRLSTALQRLQEKYNQEVPTLMRENAAYKKREGQMQALETENAALKQASADLEKRLAEAQTTAPAAKTTALATTDLQALADEWGVAPQQLAQFQQDTINAVLAKLPKPAEHPVPSQPAPDPAQQPREPHQMPAERAFFFSTLDTLIGETEAQGTAIRSQVINDPDFVVFLNAIDSSTLRPIRETAMQADASNNAVVMSKIYSAFFKWKDQQSQPTKPSNLMPRADGGPSGDLNTNQKPVYTAAQEAEFQSRVRRQHYSGIGKQPAEAKKLADEYKYWSNEFATARAENRIRG